MKLPRADKKWNKKVRAFWKASHKAYEFDVDGLEILRVACMSLDRYLQACEILDVEGVTFETTSGQVKKHPANEIEKNARQGFLQAVKMLGISLDNEEKRRPGRPGMYD